MLPLVEDNAIEPTPAPFPDIPAEIPGVVRERDIPVTAMAPVPIVSVEDAAAAESAAVLQNANIAPHVAALVQPHNIAGVIVPNAPPAPAAPYTTTYNINMVPAQAHEFEEEPAESEDEPPPLIAPRPSDGDYDSDYDS